MRPPSRPRAPRLAPPRAYARTAASRRASQTAGSHRPRAPRDSGLSRRGWDSLGARSAAAGATGWSAINRAPPLASLPSHPPPSSSSPTSLSPPQVVRQAQDWALVRGEASNRNPEGRKEASLSSKTKPKREKKKYWKRKKKKRNTSSASQGEGRRGTAGEGRANRGTNPSQQGDAAALAWLDLAAAAASASGAADRRSPDACLGRKAIVTSLHWVVFQEIATGSTS